MFDTERMEYRVTEEQFDELYKARHLLDLLSDLSVAGTVNRADLNRESLAVTCDLIGGMMDGVFPELCPDRQVPQHDPELTQSITSEETQDESNGGES